MKSNGLPPVFFDPCATRFHRDSFDCELNAIDEDEVLRGPG
jgi:hypothetical protein